MPNFQITSAGGREPLGGGNFVIADQGAVTGAQPFTAAGLAQGNQTIPGVKIEGPANLTFDAPVRLRLSYASCDHDPDQRRHIVTRDSEGNWVPVPGGFWSRNGRFVEVFVEHFSEYAIAI